MIRFLIRRLFLLIFVTWGLSLITFLLARVVHTDPARLLAGPRASPEAVTVVRTAYGLDQRLVTQYFHYLGDLVQGDLGHSFRSRRLVIDDLCDYFPATLELTLAALLITLVFGALVGIVSALRRNSWLDLSGRLVTTVGLALPSFWGGLMADLLFYSGLTILPVGNRLRQDVAAPALITGLYTVDSLLHGEWQTCLNALYHLILLATVLSFGATAVFVRLSARMWSATPTTPSPPPPLTTGP